MVPPELKGSNPLGPPSRTSVGKLPAIDYAGGHGRRWTPASFPGAAVMIHASLLPLALVPLWLCCVVANANSGEPVPGQNSSKADRPPRKVIVGTTVFGPYGKYPGLEERLDELCDLVDEMAALTAKRYPGRGLDLAILPESAATATSGPAHNRAVPLKREIRDTFGALVRRH